MFGAPARVFAEVPDLTPERWRADIRYLATAVPTVHKNAFHYTPKPEFEREIAELLRKSDSATDAEMVVGIQRLAASLGDGHSFLSTSKLFRRYPLELMDLEGSMRVLRADQAGEQALGARVIAIDATPIGVARERIRTLTPQAENAWYVRQTEAELLVCAEDLLGLGIAHSVAQATFTLQKDGERPFALTLASLSPGTEIVWKDVAQPPLSQSHRDQAFWFADLPGTRAVYVNFRNYADLEANAHRLFAHIDARHVQALVIDMRFNSGGNLSLPQRFIIPEIKRRPQLMKHGRLFVLVGRQTFSAGMTNSIDFKRKLNAILVGEPIGARPNGYQENGWIELPNSKLRMSLSTLHYQFWPDEVDAVHPDVEVPPRWLDLKQGHDAALDYVTARLRR
jgi:hypothetical protein